MNRFRRTLGYCAILLGAIGHPDVKPGILERKLLLDLRFGLDQYINLRPFLLTEEGIDFQVVRENTEGSYAGEGGFLRHGTPSFLPTCCRGPRRRPRADDC